LLAAVTATKSCAQSTSAQVEAARSVFDKSVAGELAEAVLMLSAVQALPRIFGCDLPPSLHASAMAEVSILALDHRRFAGCSWWRRGLITETGSRPQQRAGKEYYRDESLTSSVISTVDNFSLLRLGVCPSQQSIHAWKCRPAHFSSDNNP
jgi:hypothetical protein